VADSKRIGASVRRYSGFELHSTRCEVGRRARNGILCRPQRHSLLDVGFELAALGSSNSRRHVSQVRIPSMRSRITLSYESRARQSVNRVNCISRKLAGRTYRVETLVIGSHPIPRRATWKVEVLINPLKF
jgi:hypothetical protein